MQEQKMTNGPRYLAIQTTYESIEIGFYIASACIDSIKLDKMYASKHLIPDLDCLLRNNTATLEQMNFFAVNQGPGPFTSLRVIITIANGLSFATKKPLIGINGLEEFLQEFRDPQWQHTIALLNAYHNDVYFAHENNNVCINTGAKNIDTLLNELNAINETIRLIGNGVTLYKKAIIKKLGDKVYLPEPLPQQVSLDQIAKAALIKWNKQQDLVEQLLPLYLKTQEYQKSL